MVAVSNMQNDRKFPFTWVTAVHILRIQLSVELSSMKVLICTKVRKGKHKPFPHVNLWQRHDNQFTALPSLSPHDGRFCRSDGSSLQKRSFMLLVRVGVWAKRVRHMTLPLFPFLKKKNKKQNMDFVLWVCWGKDWFGRALSHHQSASVKVSKPYNLHDHHPYKIITCNNIQKL